MPNAAAEPATPGDDTKFTSYNDAQLLDPIDSAGGRCLFFELSAELRNEIYELALVSSDEIKITKETFAQPALLCTCRQIRAEASKIYYVQNQFSTRISRLDASLLHAFYQQCKHAVRPEGLSGNGVALDFDWDPRDAYWPNFLQWMKWFYDDEITGVACPDDCLGGLCCTMNAAFHIVDELQDLRWERVSTVLETVKKMKQREDGSVLRWLERSQD